LDEALSSRFDLTLSLPPSTSGAHWPLVQEGAKKQRGEKSGDEPASESSTWGQEASIVWGNAQANGRIHAHCPGNQHLQPSRGQEKSRFQAADQGA